MRTLSLIAAGERHASRSFAAALATRVLRALERRRAVRELARLDDHMLSDIGISRTDIGRAVRGFRY